MCAAMPCRGLAIAAATALLLPLPPLAGHPTFIEVADTDMLIPGGALGSTFSVFGAPSLDHGRVAFRASGSGGEEGIYIGGPRGVRLVADLSTHLPGSTSTFTGFTHASLDGRHVAFGGFGSGGEAGIYLAGPHGIRTIADLNTNLPGEASTFSAFFTSESTIGVGDFIGSLGYPSLDDGQVAFQGIGSGGEEGIYVGGRGGLRTIADLNTPHPGLPGGFSRLFELVEIDDGEVAFTGVSEGAGLPRGVPGVFIDGPGGLRTLGEVHPGDFAFGPSLDDGKIAAHLFVEGLESAIVVSDKSTGELVPLLPGNAQNVYGFPSLDNGKLAFGALLGFIAGRPEGVWLERGMGIEPFILAGDMIDGRQVTGAGGILAEALSNNRLAFSVGFIDGSSGLFIAKLRPISPD